MMDQMKRKRYSAKFLTKKTAVRGLIEKQQAKNFSEVFFRVSKTYQKQKHFLEFPA